MLGFDLPHFSSCMEAPATKNGDLNQEKWEILAKNGYPCNWWFWPPQQLLVGAEKQTASPLGIDAAYN